MELSPELQIQSVIKALNDTVIPAVDPDNATAREQARLCVALLNFTLARLPQLEDYARQDLAHWLAMADEAAPEDGDELAAARARGHSLQTDPLATRAQRESAAHALRQALAQAIDQAEPGSAAAMKLARRVVARSADVIELERAWLAELGMDSDEKLPAIETLLARRER